MIICWTRGALFQPERLRAALGGALIVRFGVSAAFAAAGRAPGYAALDPMVLEVTGGVALPSPDWPLGTAGRPQQGVRVLTGALGGSPAVGGVVGRPRDG